MTPEQAKQAVETYINLQIQRYGVHTFKLPGNDVVISSMRDGNVIEEYTLFYCMFLIGNSKKITPAP
jgi:hypothetical protein